MYNATHTMYVSFSNTLPKSIAVLFLNPFQTELFTRVIVTYLGRVYSEMSESELKLHFESSVLLEGGEPCNSKQYVS